MLAEKSSTRRLIAPYFERFADDALCAARRLHEWSDSDPRFQYVALNVALARRDAFELGAADSLANEALTSHPRGTYVRPFLFGLRADLARADGHWRESLDLCDDAERALLDQSGPIPTHGLARRQIFGVRVKVFDELGLPDIAWDWLECEREALINADDPVSLFDVAMREAELDLNSLRGSSAVRSLTAALKDPRSFAGAPELRTQLSIELGVAQIESGDATNGETTLVGALAKEGLDDSVRLMAEMALAESALSRRAFDIADEHIQKSRALLEHETLAGNESNPPPRQAALLAAYAAQLALDRGVSDPKVLHERLDALEHAYDDFLAQWDRTPLRPGGIGFLHLANRRQVLSELIRLALVLDPSEAGRARAFDFVLRAQRQGSIARRLGAPSPSAADVQRALVPKDGGILIFVGAPPRLHVFALDATHLAYDEVRDDDKLRGPLETLDEEVRRSPFEMTSKTLDQSLARISHAGSDAATALLKGEVRHAIAAWKSAIVVGDDLLGDVGFESLELERGEPLGRRLAISYLPSLPLGMALAAREVRATDRDFLLFGAPKPGPRDYAHPSPIEIERPKIERLLAPFAESRRSSEIGERATLAHFFDLELAHTGALELWVHGLYAPRRERPAGLLFASSERDDGALWCDSLDEHREWTSPRLVILAACGAARGPARFGDDSLTNLGGSYLLRGAQCVVLSDDRIELSASIEMLAVVHARLAAGDSPAEALRVARVELGKRREYAHPFCTTLLRAVGLAHSRYIDPHQ